MDPARRLRVALLLKAARFLHGTRSRGRAIALPVGHLSALLSELGHPLAVDRLEGFEQMRGKPPGSFDLDAIEAALLLPNDYFDDKLTPRSLGENLEQFSDDLDQAEPEGGSGTEISEAGSDHPDAGAGGADG